MREGYIPKDQRKKIVLLSDDLRFNSGVGVMSREMVLGTSHRYNWFQVGGSLNHPEQGKLLDASDDVNRLAELDDASVRILPMTGYGDSTLIRAILQQEKPDAIMHFTDPRYWIWLYAIEHEIRQVCPILYYSVWDNTPFPKYNKSYYESCDAIFAISKLTHNVVKHVVGPENIEVI